MKRIHCLRSGIKQFSKALGLSVCAIGLISPLQAQSPFPFALPLQVAEGPIDLRSMNDIPAGSKGRILVQDRHFVREKDGSRIRFWGVNVGGPELLVSSKEDISLMAKRLAMYGFNLVRLHHLDNCWDIERGGSLWDKTVSKRMIDPAKLDKLMFAVREFKNQGIYINVNTKVSKELTPADGLPSELNTVGDWDSGFPHQKRVDRFSRVFIDHQKSFAKELWNTTNPYTGLRLSEEPAVAFAEINNENSLVSLWPGMPLGQDLEKLPEVFTRELAGLWNAWLKKKYLSYDAIKAAWQLDSFQLGNTVTSRRTNWEIIFPGPTAGTLKLSPPLTPDTMPTANINVTKSSPTSWHQQVVIPGLTLQEGQVYTLSFEASSSIRRIIPISADLAEGDYHNIGLRESIELTPKPSAFEFMFVARDVGGEKKNRLVFHVATDVSQVEIRSLVLREGTKASDAFSEQAWATNSIKINPKLAKSMQTDWLDFLADADRAYSVEMRNWFRNELQIQSLLTDTQIEWGGVTGFQRERDSSFTDTHSYYGHPDFPNGAWNPVNWTVQRQSWIQEFSEGKGTTFAGLAKHRVTGRPFSVSEYDHPAPNDYRAEMYPLVSVIASLQDWDAFYGFCHGPWQPENVGKINGFFDNSFDPAKFCFAPSAALVFRNGWLPPLNTSVELKLEDQPWSSATTVHDIWKKAIDQPTDPIRRRYSVTPTSNRVSDVIATTSDRPSGVSLEKGPAGPVLVASNESFIFVVGFLSNFMMPTEIGSLSFGKVEGEFGAFTLVPVDGKPLKESNRLLLTTLGKAENSNMGWNKDRTTVGDQWGHAPTIIQPAAGHLQTAVGFRQIVPLQSDGSRGAAVTVDGKMSFGDQSVWYEIIR